MSLATPRHIDLAGRGAQSVIGANMWSTSKEKREKYKTIPQQIINPRMNNTYSIKNSNKRKSDTTFDVTSPKKERLDVKASPKVKSASNIVSWTKKPISQNSQLAVLKLLLAKHSQGIDNKL